MEELFKLTPLVMGIVPVVIGLVQVLKAVGMPSRVSPLAAIILGSVFVSIMGSTWQVSVVQGILIGLLASGLYSDIKTADQIVSSGSLH